MHVPPKPRKSSGRMKPWNNGAQAGLKTGSRSKIVSHNDIEAKLNELKAEHKKAVTSQAMRPTPPTWTFNLLIRRQGICANCKRKGQRRLQMKQKNGKERTSEYNRERYANKRAAETPDEAEERKRKEQERYANKKATETPDDVEEHNRKVRERKARARGFQLCTDAAA
ncbi:hypothetical protein N0V85_004111 [Neurospora sp. IMI 360204]|nr:hypothetical protein N0V85_004111 [Neurospora sp. IMI 360204]